MEIELTLNFGTLELVNLGTHASIELLKLSSIFAPYSKKKESNH
jgi:hypothetical protein